MIPIFFIIHKIGCKGTTFFAHMQARVRFSSLFYKLPSPARRLGHRQISPSPSYLHDMTFLACGACVTSSIVPNAIRVYPPCRPARSASPRWLCHRFVLSANILHFGHIFVAVFRAICIFYLHISNICCTFAAAKVFAIHSIGRKCVSIINVISQNLIF